MTTPNIDMDRAGPSADTTVPTPLGLHRGLARLRGMCGSAGGQAEEEAQE